jgi:hypothetical protein
MYALLTKKEDGSFDVPVRWTGSSFRHSDLKPLTGYTITKHALPNGHLPFFGIFPFHTVGIPVGKRAKGDPVDTFNGTSVSSFIPVEDDPDYVAPKEPTEEEKAKSAAEYLANMKANKVVEVKAEAQKRILAVAPEWKQRNFGFLHQQVSDKTKADAETSTAAAATAAAEASTAASKAHTDAKGAEANAKTTAETDGATDEQKAAYVTAQETTKTKEAEAVKAEEDSKAAEATAKAAKEAHDKEKADMVSQKAMWEKVDSIRSKSDEIEAKIAEMDKDTVLDFVAATDSNWE